MKKFFSFLLGVSFFFSAIMGIPESAYALGLMPMVIEYTLLPGKSQTRDVALYNESDHEIRVVPTVYAVDSSDLYGFPHLVPLDPHGPNASLFSFSENQDLYVLKPKETKKIGITVSLPQSIQPGGYYFSIGWGLVKGESAVTLSENPGVNIAISVPGVVTESGRIAFFGFKNHHSFTSPPVHFIADITNTGGRHFKPYGRIEIKNMFGISVGHGMLTSVADELSDGQAQAFNQRLANGSVLPGATREFYATWKPTFAFGPYTAIVSVDAEGAGTFSATHSFILLPSVFLSLCLIVVLVLIVVSLPFLKKALKHLS